MNSLVNLMNDISECVIDIFLNCVILIGLPLSVVLVLFAFSFIPSKEEHEKYTKTTYEAWCKLHYRQDLSLEEWKILRSNNLLTTKNTGTAEKY